MSDEHKQTTQRIVLAIGIVSVCCLASVSYLVAIGGLFGVLFIAVAAPVCFAGSFVGCRIGGWLNRKRAENKSSR
jgi:hypothetical protein